MKITREDVQELRYRRYSAAVQGNQISYTFLPDDSPLKIVWWLWLRAIDRAGRDWYYQKRFADPRRAFHAEQASLLVTRIEVTL